MDAGSSWSRVEWRNGGRWISSTPEITVSEPGSYSLEVFNVNNCIARDTFLLETSNNLLEANLIMAAEANVGDTVAIIDISWPLPDQIFWEFPEGMLKIKDTGDVIHGKFEEAGIYEVALHAALGKCNDVITKSITILEDGRSAEGGRLGAEEFLKTFTLHPNPNTGSFDVEIEFTDESPIVITLWNLVNSRLVGTVSDENSNQYKKHFDLQPITSGVYILKLDFKSGSRSIRFLVH